MTEPGVYDPFDLAAALYRLRDAVFLAIDEEGKTSKLNRTRATEVAMLAIDVKAVAENVARHMKEPW